MAQVQFESNIKKLFALFWLQVLKPSAVSPGSPWGQLHSPTVDLDDALNDVDSDDAADGDPSSFPRGANMVRTMRW